MYMFNSCWKEDGNLWTLRFGGLMDVIVPLSMYVYCAWIIYDDAKWYLCASMTHIYDKV